MITYKEFIKEIERLAKAVEELKNSQKLHEDEKFRSWRNEVTSTVNQILQSNYQLPCQVNIQKRTFGSLHSMYSTKEGKVDFYNMELTDTYNELKYLIDNYKKYGEPSKRMMSTESGEDIPKIITLSWIWNHAHYSLWLKLGGLLLAAFLLGVQVGYSDIYKKVVKVVMPADSKDVKTK